MSFVAKQTYPFMELPVHNFKETIAFKLAIPDLADSKLLFIWIKVNDHEIFPICENSMEGMRSVNISEKRLQANHDYGKRVVLDSGAMVVVVKIFTDQDEKKKTKLGVANSSNGGRDWLIKTRMKGRIK